MTCPVGYYIECPYLDEVICEGRCVPVDFRDICPFCISECYKEEEK